MKKIDLTGKIFGRLTVIKEISISTRRTFWECRCECGKIKVVVGDALKNGDTRSCGCLRAEVTAERSLKHGDKRNRRDTKEYKAWSKAKSRCYNKNDQKFPIYGGRGIRMSGEWLNDYSVFLENMGRCPRGKTLDRIDVNGNYEPGNCRWATPKEQARNTRNNVWLEFNGETKIEADWADELGIDRRRFNYLYKRGLTVEEIRRNVNA